MAQVLVVFRQMVNRIRNYLASNHLQCKGIDFILIKFKLNRLTLVTLGCLTGCEPWGGGLIRPPPSFKDNEWSDKKIMH